MTDTLNKNTESCTGYRTPETDWEWERLADYDYPYFGEALADFARKLERERNALKKHIDIMDAARKTASDEYFKLAVENEELEAEVKLWKENATSNKDTFDEVSKERDEAVRSCHIWQHGHSELVEDRDDWKSFAVKLENAFKLENDSLKKHLATVIKQNNERLTILQEHGLAEYGN